MKTSVRNKLAERSLQMQQLGKIAVPGIRLSDAEEAGILCQMVQKGEVTQEYFDAWVDRAKAENRIRTEEKKK